jgi:putative phosphoesterase
MIGIISDVHANLEALQAVFAGLERADSIYCVGDVVGYGPDPNECCELLRDRGVRCVRGNHDHICATLKDVGPCSSLARHSFRWTHERLTEANRQWLRGLPLCIEADGMTLVHGAPGTPRDMLNAYVFEQHYTKGSYRKLLDRVSGPRLVLGHTHLPMCYGTRARILNPGSVGQPRDGDWRAAYVTIERPVQPRGLRGLLARALDGKDAVTFHRVEYDIATTAMKLVDEPGLPGRLVKVLRRGGMGA